MHVQNAQPRIKHWYSSFPELINVPRNDHQILQRGDCCNEQIGLAESLTPISPFGDHGLPADHDVLGNREDATCEPRPQCSIEPQANFGSTRRILELLNPEPDLAERNVRRKQQVACLRRNECGNIRIWLPLACFRKYVGIEEPTSHRSTSRTGDLTLKRSKSTSARGEDAIIARRSRPEGGRRMRSNSSAATITTASRPCTVTRWGPRSRACRTTSLSLALASCRLQRLPGWRPFGFERFAAFKIALLCFGRSDQNIAQGVAECNKWDVTGPIKKPKSSPWAGRQPRRCSFGARGGQPGPTAIVSPHILDRFIWRETPIASSAHQR